MYSISEDSTEITLIRSDTLIVRVHPIRNDEEYVPEEGDIIRFAMKRKWKDSTDKVLINKVIPNDTLLLELTPEDTMDLKAPRRYVWDIELTDVNNRKDTFLRGYLLLKEEVC